MITAVWAPAVLITSVDQECVHCSVWVRTYCASCGRPVCRGHTRLHGEDHNQHRPVWTRTEPLP